jgi:hypothetical protein
MSRREAGWYEGTYQGQSIVIYFVKERVTSPNGSRWNHYWEGRFADGKPLGLGAGSKREALTILQRIIDRGF